MELGEGEVNDGVGGGQYESDEGRELRRFN